MTATIGFIVLGFILVAMGVSAGVVRRLPLTTSLLYLALGFLLGRSGLSALIGDPLERAPLLERLTEAAVLISLFTAGLKLRLHWRDRRWITPLSLATVSMVVTIALVAVVAYRFLELPLGAAILLGAVLAPTDPVLASDVQVASAADTDRLRFTLTGEAGLNDGSAFPFVMLGLGLLGAHDLGANLVRWIAVDLVWAASSGALTGWLVGTLVARLVLRLRRHHEEAVGTDELLALGLIALSYGLALLVHGYGFLAVFAAGVALRRVEARATAEATGKPELASPTAEVLRAAATTGLGTELAIGRETAPAYMAEAALAFVGQLERILEVLLVLLLGALVALRPPGLGVLWFAPLFFLVIRPLAVLVGMPRHEGPPIRRRLVMWFGIRGLGSLYYLAFAITHGLPRPLAERMTAITLAVVATSLVVHGISVTPLMKRYERLAARER